MTDSHVAILTPAIAQPSEECQGLADVGGSGTPAASAHSRDATMRNGQHGTHQGAVADGAIRHELRPGDIVEVRSVDEILGTLDEDGRLDGLPFMPEMLRYCGQRFPVFKRADKTCDTITWTGLRRLEGTVHLGILRCDGSAHGGCAAGCLMFWKEAWLKPIERRSGRRLNHNGLGRDNVVEGDGMPRGRGVRSVPENGSTPDAIASDGARAAGTSLAVAGNSSSSGPTLEIPELLARSTVLTPAAEGTGALGTVYRCQATDVLLATTPLSWWKPDQYLRDFRANGVSGIEIVRGLIISTTNSSCPPPWPTYLP